LSCDRTSEKMKTAYTSYFTDDIYIADELYYKLRARHSNLLNINIFPNFETYFNRRFRQNWSAPFALFSLYFYEPNDIIFNIKGNIDIILDKYISSIQLIIVPINRMTQINRIFDFNKTGHKRPIIEHIVTGVDLKYNQSVCESIFERAANLYKLKHILVDKAHLNLDEFLNSIFSNILNCFSVEHGRMVLWEKMNRHRQLFIKNHSSHIRPLLHYKYDHDKRANAFIGLEIQNVNEISSKDIKTELKALNITYHILLRIDSKYTTGYLDLFSKLNKLRSEEKELLNFIQKQLSFVIDNTFFFHKLLARKGTEVALFNNTDDGILVVNKNRIVVDINEPTERFTGWTKRQAVGLPCHMLYHSCDFAGTPMCNSNECPMLSMIGIMEPPMIGVMAPV
jgi:hypothetical protein